MSKPAHITKGDVLDDLGFSRAEAASLKVKAAIFEAILAEIDRRRLVQRQLVDLLDEYQPNVSNLLNGRIGKVSIEKLLYYAARLGLESTIEMRPSVRARAVRRNSSSARARVAA
ncbi:MAG TPA: XRE family transcriptional regulator [Terracidiphilus sp.]|nr:XRE family transcriptional regulator [Terracidiphilus sp.]